MSLGMIEASINMPKQYGYPGKGKNHSGGNIKVKDRRAGKSNADLIDKNRIKPSGRKS